MLMECSALVKVDWELLELFFIFLADFHFLIFRLVVDIGLVGYV